MGGNKRDPKDYIFKDSIIRRPKKPVDDRPKNIAPPWIDLGDLAFGKEKLEKTPKLK